MLKKLKMQLLKLLAHCKDHFIVDAVVVDDDDDDDDDDDENGDDGGYNDGFSGGDDHSWYPDMAMYFLNPKFLTSFACSSHLKSMNFVTRDDQII